MPPKTPSELREQIEAQRNAGSTRAAAKPAPSQRFASDHRVGSGKTYRR